MLNETRQSPEFIAGRELLNARKRQQQARRRRHIAKMLPLQRGDIVALAERFNVDRRTIHRDLEALKNDGEEQT